MDDKTHHHAPAQRRGLLAHTRSLLVLVLLAATLGQPQHSYAAVIDIVGPPGSGAFGSEVVVLPNGNLVITDPLYDAGRVENVGAVYLYNATTHALISTLTGSQAEDQVGSSGITVLPNGNYLIRSISWNNGNQEDAGAVTWANGTTGISGVVGAANSLIGSTAGDIVGNVTVLTNGNYVVSSSLWDNGAIADVGAVTWGSGSSGVVGVITTANSLLGTTPKDYIGIVTKLMNGNYVVHSTFWDNGSVVDAGSVTWANGASGLTGKINPENSLIGSTTEDMVGFNGVTALSNGNYVVNSPYWDHNNLANVGAATWANGSTGLIGVVGPTISLIGSTADDQVGTKIIALTNGNYVVSSPLWDNGNVPDVGAVTWASGSTGLIGVVSPTNSLIGSSANDTISRLLYIFDTDGVIALTNGNYVVRSPNWDNASVFDVGAATWANGNIGLTGMVSPANSLIGSTTGDQIGLRGIVPLSNGNYVVSSPEWDNESIPDAGAVTWRNGSTANAGVVSPANSLVGSSVNDFIGRITALTNGNYVVSSSLWDNGAIADVGAVTWASGTTGFAGVITPENSLIGSTANDMVGTNQVTALTNGNYVVSSSQWDNGSVVDVGAVTWASGNGGLSGAVSVANSLVGSTAGDQIGVSSFGVLAFSDGSYSVLSPYWDNGNIPNAGAVTWLNGTEKTHATVDATNSVFGSLANRGLSINPQLDSYNRQLVVGLPAENRVALLPLPLAFSPQSLWLPMGELAHPYNHQLDTMGYPGQSFSLAQGSLPPGLSLAADGTISGTPTQAGRYTFSVQVSNGVNSDAMQELSLIIATTIHSNYMPLIRR